MNDGNGKTDRSDRRQEHNIFFRQERPLREESRKDRKEEIRKDSGENAEKYPSQFALFIFLCRHSGRMDDTGKPRKEKHSKKDQQRREARIICRVEAKIDNRIRRTQKRNGNPYGDACGQNIERKYPFCRNLFSRKQKGEMEKKHRYECIGKIKTDLQSLPQCVGFSCRKQDERRDRDTEKMRDHRRLVFRLKKYY